MTSELKIVRRFWALWIFNKNMNKKIIKKTAEDLGTTTKDVSEVIYAIERTIYDEMHKGVCDEMHLPGFGRITKREHRGKSRKGIKRSKLSR